MWNAGLDEVQAGIKIARRHINNLRYADDTTLMAESEEELKSLLMKVKVKSLSHVRLFATPWTVAYQNPLSMGFPRQEYWSGMPFPSPGDPPDPGIELRSPALKADALLSETPGKSWWKWKESEKAGLKLNVQKSKIVTSGPNTSW